MTVVVAQKEDQKAKAKMHYGDKAGQEKTKLLLKEVGLPNGLLPLKDIIECGYIEKTGFVWLKQKNKVEHYFEKVGRVVTYSPEITAYVEKGKIKKLTGVKSKEMFVWLTVCEISIDGELPAGKLTCWSTSGLFRVFPALAFEVREDNEKKNEEETKK